MKINRFKSFFLLPALFMGITLAGCSNSEDIVDGQTQEGMGSVSFTIKEKNQLRRLQVRVLQHQRNQRYKT